MIGGGAWCEAVLRQCRQSGFAGALYAVHPTRKEIAGVPAVTTIADLPEAPDASFIGINRDATHHAVTALAGRGAGGAVCFANGFAESADGRKRQHALLAAAGDLALLGPNCYGFLNNLDGVALWPDQHGCKRVTAGVALITQSSNIALNLTMQRRGLPLAYVVTCGNQAQQGLATIASTLLDDPRVTALGLHVEGFGDIRALECLSVKAQDLGKAIVVLKTGKTRESQQATLSHTASLAGSDAGAEALLARLGMASAPTLASLLETLKVLHVNRAASGVSSSGAARSGFGTRDRSGSSLSPGSRFSSRSNSSSDSDSATFSNPRGVANSGSSADSATAFTSTSAASSSGALRIASLSCSGGEAALVADTARLIESRLPSVRGRQAGQAFTFPALGDARQAALRRVLGPRVAINNPLDYDTGIWRDESALATVFRTLSGPDIDITLLILDFPRDDRCDPIEWETVIRALESAVKDTGARYAVLSTLPENLPEAVALRLLTAGIAPLAGLEDALQALHLTTLAAVGPGLDANEVLLIDPVPRRVTTMLTEHEAKQQLKAFGLDVPPSEQAASPDEAGEAATRLGFPVVLKGEGIAHKSDVGAVIVGLHDPAATVAAAEGMPATRFLVEAQIDASAVELLVGVIHDPAHGFVLTLAAGGVFTELLADRASLLLPTTAEAIGQALDRLRIARAIDGLRGHAGADRGAIIDAVRAVQAYVVANACSLQEIEINPLSCRIDGVIALDALVVLSATSSTEERSQTSTKSTGECFIRTER